MSEPMAEAVSPPRIGLPTVVGARLRPAAREGPQYRVCVSLSRRRSRGLRRGDFGSLWQCSGTTLGPVFGV